MSPIVRIVVCKVVTVVALALLLFACLPATAQPSRQVQRNLMAFARLFGYVNYFNPADEARQVYWPEFAVYGCHRMLMAKNDDEAIAELRKLFYPVAPALRIARSADRAALSAIGVIPADTLGLEVISWQHLGINTYAEPNIYSSIRLNRLDDYELLHAGSEQVIRLNKPLDLSAFAGNAFSFRFKLRHASATGGDYPVVVRPGKGFDTVSNPPTFVKSGAVETITLSGTLTGKPGKCVFEIWKKTDTGRMNLDSARLEIFAPGQRVIWTLPASEVALVAAGSGTDTSTTIYSASVSWKTAPALFHRQVHIGELLSKELVNGISCSMPLAVYGDEMSTYPRGDRSAVTGLLKSIDVVVAALMNKQNMLSADSLDVRLADVIITWNILKHSYPYWDDVKTDAGQILEQALAESFSDRNRLDFLQTLKRMSSPYNDGHMFIDFYDGSNPQEQALPVALTLAENQVVVKATLAGKTSALRVGDVLLALNGVPVQQILKQEMREMSGSRQWKTAKALTTLANGPPASTVRLLIRRQRRKMMITVERKAPAVQYRRGSFNASQRKSGWVTPGVFYFDLTTDTLRLDKAQTANFKQARSIIFDLRGYPVNQESYTNIVALLLKSDTTDTRFYTPEIIYPDYSNVTYQQDRTMIRSARIPIAAKVYVLADATAQSAAETILSQIKDFKLATIIGQPTSGTNGNINTVFLPGRIRYSFSGLLCKNNDGSKHHLVGVIPDYYVKTTLSGVAAGADEIFNKALQLANHAY